MSATPLFQGKGLLRSRDLVYASPGAFNAPERRKIPRCLSYSAAVPSAPMVETPRTACPQNGGAFSYNPAHLSNWYMAEELWSRLPARLTNSVAAVQHAGAAVFTGFERLEELGKALPTSDEFDVEAKSIAAVPRATKPRGLSTSSTLSSDTYSSSDTSSPASSMVSTPLSLPSVSSVPVSPFSLSEFKFEQSVSKPRRRHHERSYTTPMDPHTEYYARELSHLRTDSLPCLRHAIRIVDREMFESKRLAEFDPDSLKAFEAWWTEKKGMAIGLDQKGQALSNRQGIPTNGLGWSA